MSDRCECVKPLVNLQGICKHCSLERLHVLPKTPAVSTYLPEPKAAA